jgi:single-stranded-DNA-specific exonuclease
MNVTRSLLSTAHDMADDILHTLREGRKPLIVGHIDADGITSSSIMAKAIMREGGRFHLRIINDLTPKVLDELAKEDHGYYIFTDLGAGFANLMAEKFNERWLVIDHHKPPREDSGFPNVFNAWFYGHDGSREVCASSLAFLVASAMNRLNEDMAWLPVIGAVADRQDQGDKRSLISLNRSILEKARDKGLVDVAIDLVLSGRETRPVHEALAYTSVPFIPGLTGNKEACYAALVSIGLRLTEDGRFRTPAELDEGEKKKILDTVLLYVSKAEAREALVEQLLGEVYTLLLEDEGTPLRDAREFATMLNACGRMRRSGVGVALCLGDRGESLIEGSRVLQDYRQMLAKTIEGLLGDPSRIIERDNYYQIIGDGLVPEELVGSIASILSSSPRFSDKILLLRSLTSGGEVKVSVRMPPLHGGRDLGDLMRSAAESVNGWGGGHTMAAGARIPSQSWSRFISKFEEILG